MLFKVAVSAAAAGAVMFYLGVKRQKRDDVFNTSLISPMALQFFGGALTIGGLVVSVLTYMRGLV